MTTPCVGTATEKLYCQFDTLFSQQSGSILTTPARELHYFGDKGEDRTYVEITQIGNNGWAKRVSSADSPKNIVQAIMKGINVPDANGIEVWCKSELGQKNKYGISLKTWDPSTDSEGIYATAESLPGFDGLLVDATTIHMARAMKAAILAVTGQDIPIMACMGDEDKFLGFYNPLSCQIL